MWRTVSGKSQRTGKTVLGRSGKVRCLPVGGSLGRMLQPESNPQRAAKRHWELTPNVYRVPELAGPEIKSTNYEINAYITADETTEGVIYAVGEHIGGQALFIMDGKLRYSYSTLGLYWHDFDGDVKIPHGDIKITLKHTMKEPKLNGPSTVEFFINDEKVGEMDITATVYGAYTGHETFDIGRDEGMPVNEEYADKGKFEFTPGQLHKVVFDIKNPTRSRSAEAGRPVRGAELGHGSTRDRAQGAQRSLGTLGFDTTYAFGSKEEVRPVDHLVAAAPAGAACHARPPSTLDSVERTTARRRTR
jgi:hypothetical protein